MEFLIQIQGSSSKIYFLPYPWAAFHYISISNNCFLYFPSCLVLYFYSLRCLQLEKKNKKYINIYIYRSHKKVHYFKN